MKIVADDKIPFLKGVFEPFANVEYLPGDRISCAALKNTNALLTRSITKCNAELLDNTSLKFIASATIGDDHIDKAYCLENNIQWTTAKGCNASAVEQYVITSLLLVAQRQNIILRDQTIGIIGVGNIGSRVARVCNLMGMKVLLNDPPRERKEVLNTFISIEEIQAKADIITFHVPLYSSGEDKTFHLADDSFFKQLKKKCVLINASRGEVVDGNALKQAIKQGVIKNAIMDVWENEPKIDSELLELVDIATPHIAGYSISGKANGTSMTVQAVSKHFNLGIDNWFPELDSKIQTIKIDGAGLSDQEILNKIYNQIYPIQNDDTALRNDAVNFEKLRREYTFRSENDSFQLNLMNVSHELGITLKSLGFIIQKNN